MGNADFQIEPYSDRSRRRAGAVHQVKAAMMSQDGRWQKRWPGPMPVLELPVPAYPSAAA